MQVELKESILNVTADFNDAETYSQVYEILLKVHELSAVIGSLNSDRSLELLKAEVNDLKERVNSKAEILKPKAALEKEVQVATPYFSRPVDAAEDKLQKIRSRLGNISRSPLFTQTVIPVRQACLLLVGKISLHLPHLDTSEGWIERLESIDLKAGNALEQLKELKEAFENKLKEK